jgi:hypothetical protein
VRFGFGGRRRRVYGTYREGNLARRRRRFAARRQRRGTLQRSHDDPHGLICKWFLGSPGHKSLVEARAHRWMRPDSRLQLKRQIFTILLCHRCALWLHRWRAIALSHDRGRAHAVARTKCARGRKWFSSISIATKQAISLTALGIIRKCSAQGKELKLPDAVRLEIPCIGKYE